MKTPGCYSGLHGRPGASRLVEPEVYMIPRALLKGKILSYKYKCKYKRKVLFTARKEIITSSKFKKV